MYEMWTLSTYLLCFAALLCCCNAAWSPNPVANPDAVVQFENARFTILTPSIIRMEYSATNEFDDNASIAFLNRYFEHVPSYTKTISGGVLTIETDFVTLTYNPHQSVTLDAGGQHTPVNHPQFAPGQLSAKLRVFPHSTWTVGAAGAGNLHGTIRTLDRVGDPVNLACPKKLDFLVYYSHCEEGLVSQDGWVLVDDTVRPRMQRRHNHASSVGAEDFWPVAPNKDGIEVPPKYIDWYLFAHGFDYKLALREFTQLSGPIPLSPRYALGPAFSRWYQWSDIENIDIVQSGFASNGIPLDVLVVDMDWHYTYPRGLPNDFGVQVQGWTGHTVYPYLFPDATHFLAYLKRRNVYVTFNHHPAAGIEFHEAVYPAFARALGRNPATGETIVFDIANATWASLYFNHVIKPIDDLGMEYWWLDFQQEPFTTVPYLNPTIMCNHAWWTNDYRYGDAAPRQKAEDRPFLMGRFGGLGAHRYPIGFVGDTYVKWNVLRYETYFMPTASNVAFQWTHDIGGFEGHSPPEFFTRHLQFGTFSPALRTHSSKRSTARSIWTYPLRTRLVPYIATAQRIAYDTGLPLIRPMYYEFPLASHVYQDQALHQYFFGDDVWIAPIAEPARVDSKVYNVSGAPVTNWTVWLPPGKWIEWFSYESFEAPAPNGRFITRDYSIADAPIFSRPGTIIPTRTLPSGAEVLGLSSQVPDALTFLVFGGVDAADGAVTTSARLYDDDGKSIAYAQKDFAWSDIACLWEETQVSCTLSPPLGDFAAKLPQTRLYDWRFISTYPPEHVYVDGKLIPRDNLGVPDAYGENPAWQANTDAWGYDGKTLSTWVHVGSGKILSVSHTVKLVFTTKTKLNDALLTSGFHRQMQRALSCKEEIDKVYGALFPSDVESMLNVTAASVRMSVAKGGEAQTLLQSVKPSLRDALSTVKKWNIPLQHPVRKTQLRCQRVLSDAIDSYAEVLPTDAAFAAATGPITYKYEVGEHLKAPEPTVTDSL